MDAAIPRSTCAAETGSCQHKKLGPTGLSAIGLPFFHNLAGDHGLEPSGDFSERTALALDAWGLSIFVDGSALDAVHCAPGMQAMTSRLTSSMT
jgi:hypothetical protein